MNFILLLTASMITLVGLPPHWSILLGLGFSLFLPKSPFIQNNGKKLSGYLLQLSVILLGASLNFQSVLKEGSQGLIVTFVSISLIFLMGYSLAKIFKIPSPLSELIISGTSICGGSAISAVAPVLKSDSLSMATALGIVFILNAMAVFLFPQLGLWLDLSQSQFGTWAALAIHDTSSVVAAGQIYGDEAMKVGTTLKLTRALWIIPLTFLFAFKSKSKDKAKLTYPWFILFFLLLSLTFTVFDGLHFLISPLTKISKTGLSLTLFLIGMNLSKEQLKKIGVKPILFGILLWILTLSLSLFYVFHFIQ